MRITYASPVPKTLDAAATLYVLMLTSYNGIWQLKLTGAHTGKFGASQGFKEDTIIINPDLIKSWSKALQQARLFSGSYQDIEITTGNALIYVDPPYRGSVMMYGREFDDDDQEKLVQWCIEKSLQNHTVIFSNRELFDKFFSELFRENEDEYKHFPKSYVRGTKSHELVVVLEPERLKRNQIIIDGKVVTFKLHLLTKMLKENPIIKEYGITHAGLLEFNRRQK